MSANGHTHFTDSSNTPHSYVVTVVLIFLNIYHFNYTFSNTEAHTHQHTRMISTPEE